jgi:hypothetical protein
MERAQNPSMSWTIWALLLLTHGAFSRWARTSARYALMTTCADALLLAIALITIDRLQGLGLVEILRIGTFFVAFGMAGRQLMGGMLPRSAARGG